MPVAVFTVRAACLQQLIRFLNLGRSWLTVNDNLSPLADALASNSSKMFT